jgi:hypothetical protein
MTLDQIREELGKLLESAQAGSKAIDAEARSFNLGHAAGLRDALKLIDKALQAERTYQSGCAGQELPSRVKEAMSDNSPLSATRGEGYPRDTTSLLRRPHRASASRRIRSGVSTVTYGRIT